MNTGSAGPSKGPNVQDPFTPGGGDPLSSDVRVHCGNSRALLSVQTSNVACELRLLLLMDQYPFSLKKKYIYASTTGACCRY